MTAVNLTSHKHLWMHFTELAAFEHTEVPTIVRGEGVRLYDATGTRYLDALSSLYCVNVGHGRGEIAGAMAKQARMLAYAPIWGQATPPALELSSRIIELAPPGFGRVFFTGGGGESVDAAWKLARQYHRLRGNAGKFKVVARAGAYHGTTLGALSITGIPSLRAPFEPLVPGVVHAPNVDPFHAETAPLEHSVRQADAIATVVEAEGPATVGAIIVEPVQNSGGCLVPEPEYFTRLREICDEYDLLLISDETICAWGRLGTYFGCQAFGYTPDIITTAKGLTSAYAPMGAVIASDAVVQPFLEPGATFSHGLTFGGHPVAAAAALENLRILEDERLCERAVEAGGQLGRELEALRDIPIVGDVRGRGLFRAIELVRDQTTNAPPTSEQTAALKDRIPARLLELRLICRAFHRGAPILQFAPPLIISEAEIDELASIVRSVLTDALSLMA